MASTGERMLELLGLLQARQRWTGDDLAERLEISHRTLRRDVERLRNLGYPVNATRGLAGGYQLGPGGRLPPLLLTDSEAVAIAIGLRHAANQPIGGMTDAAIGALAKVTQLLPPQLRSQAEAVATAMSAPTQTAADVALETLTTIARASRDGQRLRLAYRDRAGETTDRTVEPHHLVPLGPRWYLIGWDLDRDDWRTFRLDRIDEPQPTNQTFGPKSLPASDPVTYITESFAVIPATYHVEAVVEAPLQTVQNILGPWGTASEEGPTTTRLTMDVDDLSWAVMMLAALNVDIHHTEPAEMRTLLQQLAGHLRGPTTDRPLHRSASEWSA